MQALKLRNSSYNTSHFKALTLIMANGVRTRCPGAPHTLCCFLLHVGTAWDREAWGPRKETMHQKMTLPYTSPTRFSGSSRRESIAITKPHNAPGEPAGEKQGNKQPSCQA